MANIKDHVKVEYGQTKDGLGEMCIRDRVYC